MLSRASDALPGPIAEVIATAAGRSHREDPVAPHTGGPAGNARLTAWLGVLLLAAFLVELLTLVSLQRFVSVHILVGALLVPLALAKTVTTTSATVVVSVVAGVVVLSASGSWTK